MGSPSFLTMPGPSIKKKSLFYDHIQQQTWECRDFNMMFSLPLDIYPEEGLLDHMAVLV